MMKGKGKSKQRVRPAQGVEPPEAPVVTKKPERPRPTERPVPRRPTRKKLG